MPVRTGRKSELVHHGATEARREYGLSDKRNVEDWVGRGSLPPVASVTSC